MFGGGWNMEEFNNAQENITEDTREQIKQKLRQYYDGRIVRKDLTKSIREGANVPVYVLEYLLGQYCNSDDEEIIEEGEKISFDVPIVANSREDAPEKRTFHEKFTLKSREYKYGDKYSLVLADANDEKNVLQQYEFMIDIAFVDDFGF